MANDEFEHDKVALPTTSNLQAISNLEDEQFTSKSSLRDEVLEVQEAQPGQVAKDVFSLRPKFYSLITAVVARLVFLAVIVGCIALGIVYRPFLLNKVQVGILYFSEDAQVAIIGLVNQIPNYLLQMSLHHISTVLLTIWMALPTKYPGIEIGDFEIEDELTKPWVTVYNFSSKLRRLGWQGTRWSAFLRYLLSFAAAISVLLLGAAINIIALPKLRWQPSSGSGVFPETPLLRIQNISWAQFASEAQAMFANNDEESIKDTTNSLIAASIFPALGVLRPRFENINSSSSSWSNAYTFERYLLYYWGGGVDEIDGLVPWPQAPHGTGITGFTLNGTLQTVSLQAGLLADMWVGFQHSDVTIAKDSIGIDGLLHVTLPLLSTSCQELPAVFNAANDTVVISSQNSMQTHNLKATMSMIFPLVVGFNGAFCNISLQQVLFSVLVVTDTTESYDLITIERLAGSVIRYLPVTGDDIRMMESLASKFEDSLPALNALSPGNFAQMAQHIGGAGNITAGSTAVVGTTLQHLITVAQWSTSPTSEMFTTGPIQYRIYGAGPRLM